MHLGSVCKKGFESNAVSVAIDCFRPSRSETEYFYSSRYEGSYIAGPLITCISHWSSRRKHPFSETSRWKFWWTVPIVVKVKVKWSRFWPCLAQRVSRGIALLFHDRGTRRGWVVSSTPQPHFTPGKDPVPILQEAEWAPGLVWMGGKSRPHRDSIPDRPARSQSLYRLSYPAPYRDEPYLKLWM